MAIIHLGTPADRGKPNFSTHLLSQDYRYGWEGRYEDRPVILGPNVYHTHESHHGLCLREVEHNGRDDSDFVMVVWNPVRHEPETILFATTRGWSYPCYGSAVDATPEVVAEYKLYLEGETRLADMARLAAKVAARKALHNDCRTIAKAAGVPTGKVIRLARTWGADKVQAVAMTFGKALRSEFKLKLKAQIVAWLNDPSPKYATPLSSRQMEFFN